MSTFDPHMTHRLPVVPPFPSNSVDSSVSDQTALNQANLFISAPPAQPQVDAAQTPMGLNDAVSSEKSCVDRAEGMVNRLTDTFWDVSSRCSRWFVRAVSGVKEGAQDFWAEAQSIRRGANHQT